MRTALIALALASPSIAFGQASTDVLWYSGNGGTELDTVTFLNYVSGTLAGNVSFQGAGSWGSFALDDYRYVILARPTEAFTPDQVDDLLAYIDNNGLVVIAGDSNAAGATHITSTNALLTDLGRTMQLNDVNIAAPDIDEDGQPDCALGEVVNTSTFIAPGNPLSMLNTGDISEGSGVPLNNVTVFVDQVSSTYTNVAREGLVLLTADYDFFTSAPCGIQAKQSFWNGMHNAICDIDVDGANSAICGGFDCDDNDPSVGSSFEWLDMDGDGFGDPDLNAPCVPDAVPSGDDCDDSDPEINPNADEVCDLVDNNCDGDIDIDVVSAPDWYPDLDNDGHGNADDPFSACEPPQNHVALGDDCNDTDGAVSPTSEERCNGIDDDCDGQTDEACPTNSGPPVTQPPKETCGCGHAPSGGLLLALFGLLGLRRRTQTR